MRKLVGMLTHRVNHGIEKFFSTDGSGWAIDFSEINATKIKSLCSNVSGFLKREQPDAVIRSIVFKNWPGEPGDLDFSRFKKLEKLDLSYDKPKVLVGERRLPIFPQPNNLIYLDLSNYCFGDLQSGDEEVCFNDMPKLQRLKLNNCHASPGVISSFFQRINNCHDPLKCLEVIGCHADSSAFRHELFAFIKTDNRNIKVVNAIPGSAMQAVVVKNENKGITFDLYGVTKALLYFVHRLLPASFMTDEFSDVHANIDIGNGDAVLVNPVSVGLRDLISDIKGRGVDVLDVTLSLLSSSRDELERYLLLGYLRSDGPKELISGSTHHQLFKLVFINLFSSGSGPKRSIKFEGACITDRILKCIHQTDTIDELEGSFDPEAVRYFLENLHRSSENFGLRRLKKVIITGDALWLPKLVEHLAYSRIFLARSGLKVMTPDDASRCDIADDVGRIGDFFSMPGSGEDLPFITSFIKPLNREGQSIRDCRRRAFEFTLFYIRNKSVVDRVLNAPDKSNQCEIDLSTLIQYDGVFFPILSGDGSRPINVVQHSGLNSPITLVRMLETFVENQEEKKVKFKLKWTGSSDWEKAVMTHMLALSSLCQDSVQMSSVSPDFLSTYKIFFGNHEEFKKAFKFGVESIENWLPAMIESMKKNKKSVEQLMCAISSARPDESPAVYLFRMFDEIKKSKQLGLVGNQPRAVSAQLATAVTASHEEFLTMLGLPQSDRDVENTASRARISCSDDFRDFIDNIFTLFKAQQVNKPGAQAMRCLSMLAFKPASKPASKPESKPESKGCFSCGQLKK